MKKIIFSSIGLLLLVGIVSIAQADVNAITPSTNEINQANGWAHVNQLSQGIHTTDLEFVSTRNFYSCFEYRTDGDASQATTTPNPNSDITDGTYPYVCVNNSTSTATITADEYVEVRMVFGAERDERFDWTRFDVAQPLTTPEILGFINPTLSCGAITNIHSTMVDWTDASGGVGGVEGYDYTINAPLMDGTGQYDWSVFTPISQYGISLNEGMHTIKVRAKDGMGNVSEWSNACSITADWTAPVVVITNPLDNATISDTVEIRGSVTDTNPDHYFLTITDVNGNQVAGPGVVHQEQSFIDQSLMLWDTTQVADGEYIIKLEARDAANNKDSESVSRFTVMVNNTSSDDDSDDDSQNGNTTPESKDQCKKGGWTAFSDPSFKNQGDCVSWLMRSSKAKGNKK